MTALLRLIPAPYVAVLALLIAATLYGAGYIKGRADGRVAAMKDTVEAYQKREGIDHDVSGLDAVRLCRELGGVQSDCEQLRGMETDPAKTR